MNAWQFSAGLTALGGIAIHIVLPEMTFFRRIPGAPLPEFELPRWLGFVGGRSPEQTNKVLWRYLRAGWHFLSVDGVVTGCLLLAASFGALGSPDAANVFALATAIRFAAYGVLWFAVVAAHHTTPFNAPQWLLMFAVAVQSWLGAR